MTRDDQRATPAEWLALIAFFVLVWGLIILIGVALVEALT